MSRAKVHQANMQSALAGHSVFSSSIEYGIRDVSLTVFFTTITGFTEKARLSSSHKDRIAAEQAQLQENMEARFNLHAQARIFVFSAPC